MFIKQVIIEGFKSYANRVEVGPFHEQFNAVTGPNGSGKSNILDAICFVMGLTELSNARAMDQTDLIHARGTRGVSHASVTITFDNTRPVDTCPDEYKACTELVITRQIKINQGSSYRINGRMVTQEKIHDLFHALKLSIKNPQFLIMQGRITRICNASDSELLGLIEEAAETSMYKVKSANAKKTLAKKNDKVKEIDEILEREIGPKMKVMKEEAEMYSKYERLKMNIEQSDLKCAVYEYLAYQQAMKKYQEDIERLQEDLVQCAQRQSDLKSQVESSTNDMKELEQTIDEAAPKATEKDKASRDVATFTANYKNLESRFTKDTEALKQDRKRHEKAKKAGEKAEEDLGRARAALELAQQRFKDMEERVAQLESSLSRMRGGGARGRGGHDESTTMQGQLMQAEQLIASLESELQTAKLRHDNAEHQLRSEEEQLDNLRTEQERLEAELEDQEKQLQAKKLEHSQRKHSIAPGGSTARSVSEIEAEIRLITTQISQIVDQIRGQEAALRNRLDFQFARWTRPFDESRVRGRVGSLINLVEEKEGVKSSALALETVAGGGLYNVVVDNDVTGRELIQQGQLRNRITVLPMNKIEGKTIPRDIVEQIERRTQGRARLALDLVEMDSQYQNISQYVFGSTFVCENGDIANDITFKSGLRVRSVTKDGDAYNPGGTLSGGFRQTQEGPLIALANIAKLKTLVRARQARLEELRKELEAAKGQDAMSRAVEDLEFHVNQKRDILQKSRYNRKLANIQRLKAEMQTYADTIEKASQRLATNRTMVNDLKQAIAAMSSGTAAEKAKVLEGLQAELDKAERQLKIEEEAKQQAMTAASRAEVTVESSKEECKRFEESEGEAAKRLLDLEGEMIQVRNKLAELKARERELEDQFNAANASYKNLSANLVRLRKQIQDLHVDLEKRRKEEETLKATVLDRKARIEEAKKRSEALNNYHRITESKVEFDFDGFDLNQQRQDNEQQRRELEQLSRTFNRKSKPLQMLEKAEGEYKELLKNRDTLLEDRNQIERFIAEVDTKRQEKLKCAYKQVSKYFNEIFSQMLPTCSCYLAPVEAKDNLVGLEMRVAFDRIEKSSLSELSGGQRSLLALSLILALLKYSPAPLYILDEVDAALDLSHTQNIGSIIKTQFSQSQFLVVSLKEGMFNHADVLFRTSFVDGVSKVTRIANESSRR